MWISPSKRWTMTPLISYLAARRLLAQYNMSPSSPSGDPDAKRKTPRNVPRGASPGKAVGESTERSTQLAGQKFTTGLQVVLAGRRVPNDARSGQRQRPPGQGPIDAIGFLMEVTLWRWLVHVGSCWFILLRCSWMLLVWWQLASVCRSTNSAEDELADIGSPIVVHRQPNSSNKTVCTAQMCVPAGTTITTTIITTYLGPFWNVVWKVGDFCTEAVSELEDAGHLVGEDWLQDAPSKINGCGNSFNINQRSNKQPESCWIWYFFSVSSFRLTGHLLRV